MVRLLIGFSVADGRQAKADILPFYAPFTFALRNIHLNTISKHSVLCFLFIPVPKGMGSADVPRVGILRVCDAARLDPSHVLAVRRAVFQPLSMLHLGRD
jgi:hypothetical protein